MAAGERSPRIGTAHTMAARTWTLDAQRGIGSCRRGVYCSLSLFVTVENGEGRLAALCLSSGRISDGGWELAWRPANRFPFPLVGQRNLLGIAIPQTRAPSGRFIGGSIWPESSVHGMLQRQVNKEHLRLRIAGKSVKCLEPMLAIHDTAAVGSRGLLEPL